MEPYGPELEITYTSENLKLVNLIGEKGPGYWREEIIKNRGAANLYGFGFLLITAIFTVLYMSDMYENNALNVLLWITYGALFVRTSLIQVPILPFLGASVTGHYIVTFILAIIGCGGPVLYFVLLHYISNADSTIEKAISAFWYDDEINGSKYSVLLGRGFLVEEPASISPEFASWCKSLEAGMDSSRGRYILNFFPKSILLEAYNRKLDYHKFLHEYRDTELSGDDKNRVLKVLQKLEQHKKRSKDLSAKSDPIRIVPMNDGPIVTPKNPINTEQTPQGISKEGTSSEPNPSSSDELSKLFMLFSNGSISEEEFRKLKSKLKI